MIRVAIVDDHALVRAGLRQFLADHVDLRVVAECASARELMDVVRAEACDVVLLDIALPGTNGVDALAAVKARAPQLPVLMLSGYPESTYATALMKQGAAGYLVKDGEPEEIVKAIRTVVLGRPYVSPTMAERLALQLVAPPGEALPHERLSERELQVFLHLAQGQTVGQLAEDLHLSVKTVSTYRSRVLEKLQLQTNSELTYYALKHGLIH